MPAKIPAGKVSNGIQDNTDFFVTLATAAGITDIVNKLKVSNKVHIDGVTNFTHWTGNAPSARNVYIYYNPPESQLTAIRIGNWKSHMLEREGFFDFNRPSARIFNLRMDPTEKHEGWKSEETAMKLGIAWDGQVQDALGAWLKSLEEFPPRQKGGTLTPNASQYQ